MRMIDAEKLKDVLENVKNHLEAYPNVLASYKECVMSLIDVVNAQPTITPPPNDPLTLEGGYSHEIVHCKDCVNLYFKYFSAFCPHRVSACRPEGFCEHGERRRPEIDS